MSPPIRHVFAAHLRAAELSEPMLEPAAILRALAYVLFLEAVGEREAIPPSEACSLAALGETALARVRLVELSELSDDDADLLRQAIPLAEAGLALLSGADVDLARVPRERVEPSPARLLSALHGEISGIEAGRLAARFLARGDERLRFAHRKLEEARVSEPGLRLAAAPSSELRDPRDGRRVLYDERHGVEVVLFEDDGTLAAYAESDYVALESDALEPLLTQAGYALATITRASGGRVRGVVRLDDAELDFEAQLPESPRSDD